MHPMRTAGDPSPALPRGARSSVRLFTVFGVPINVDASFVLVYALITWPLAVSYFPAQVPALGPAASWASGLLAALLLFVSVLIHELAHSVVARRHGVAVSGITLHLLGGVSELEDEPPDPRTELRIAAAGPLASFLIAGVLSLARAVAAGPWWEALLSYLILVNAAVGLFNLIPGFPLDGGRILRAVLWRRRGDFRRATATAGRVGGVVAIALIVLGALQAFGGALLSGLWLALIGFFLRQTAAASGSQATLRSALGTLPVSEVMVREIVTVSWDASVAELARLFWSRHVASMPVTDGPVVRGVATVDDLGRVAAEEWPRTSVQRVTRPLADDLTVAPTTTALEAWQKASANGLGRLVVLEGSRLVGYLSLGDLTHVLALRSLPGATAGRPEFAARPSLRRAA
jgi:Zn-dependent protease/predicted transcriptional regulator